MNTARLLLTLLFLSAASLFAQAPDTLWRQEILIPQGACCVEVDQVLGTQDGGCVVSTRVARPSNIPPYYQYWRWILFIDSSGLLISTDYANGAYILTSSMDNAANGDVFIANNVSPCRISRWHPNGELVWNRTYPYDRGGAPVKVRGLPSGGALYIVSYWGSQDDFSYYLVEISATGDSLRSFSFNNDQRRQASGMFLSQEGNVLVCGAMPTTDETSYCPFIALFDSTLIPGIEISIPLRSSPSPSVSSAWLDENGTGYAVGFSGGNYIARIVTGGQIDWTRLWGIHRAGIAAVWPASNGGVIEIDRYESALRWYDVTGDLILLESNMPELEYSSSTPLTPVTGEMIEARPTDSSLVVMKWRPIPSSILSARPASESVPIRFLLLAYPNPFNPTTTLSFALPVTGQTRIAVYDLLGREVQLLEDRVIAAGEHLITFDGSSLPSGLYFARMQSGAFTATQKLLLLK